jgi:Flp pilus assembly protein TadD
MLKRTLIIALLVPTLVLSFQPSQAVHGIALTPEEIAVLDAADATEAADAADSARAEKSKDGGNGFMRAIKAPFKAIGRLFGGGRKNDSKKLARVTEKDLRKFESVPVQVVNDTRVSQKTTNDENRAPAVATNASDYSEYCAKGKELLNAGDLNGAIAELSRAASIDPKSGEAKNLLGIAYESKGLRQRALDSFKAAVEADKNNPEYLNNYGYLLYQNHDYDDATKYLKRAAKLSPDDPRIWNNLGLAQCRRGKFDDAFQSFVRAGGDFSGHVNIASQLMAQGQAKEAIKHLEKAQALQPNSTDVLAKLVSLYELTGRISDAEEARRSIVALRTFAEANK